MKKAMVMFLWALTLGAGCHCGDDPCDRDGRDDDRDHRWGRHHDRDRDRDEEDEREVCEEDGGAATGDAATSDAGGAATGDAGSGAGDGGAAADSCVHPAQ